MSDKKSVAYSNTSSMDSELGPLSQRAMDGLKRAREMPHTSHSRIWVGFSIFALAIVALNLSTLSKGVAFLTNRLGFANSLWILSATAIIVLYLSIPHTLVMRYAAGTRRWLWSGFLLGLTFGRAWKTADHARGSNALASVESESHRAKTKLKLMMSILLLFAVSCLAGSAALATIFIQDGFAVAARPASLLLLFSFLLTWTAWKLRGHLRAHGPYREDIEQALAMNYQTIEEYRDYTNRSRVSVFDASTSIPRR